MKEIIWSPKAVKSLENLCEFILKKWETKVVQNLLDDIDKKIILITKYPEMYPLFSRKKKLRKCVIRRRTLLFYRNYSNRIEIVLLVDSRQNPQNYYI